MRIQTEITSRIANINEKIYWKNRIKEVVLSNPPAAHVLANLPSGPLEPDCVLGEEEFTPAYDSGEFSAPTRERALLRQQKSQMFSDFTSSVSIDTQPVWTSSL